MDANEINHGGGLPPYMQLAALLRERIEQGELTGKLRSEKAIAQEYGISPSTVRKALKLLRDEGLISTVQGWASRVVPPGDRPPS